MKVVFINPPVIRIKRDFYKGNISFTEKMKPRYWFHDVLVNKNNLRYGVRAGSRWPWTVDFPLPAIHFPFLMAYAASLLKSKGINVELIDAIAQREYSYRRFLLRLKKMKPDIVVLETSTPTFDIDIWLGKKISEFSDLALAGPHVAVFAKQIQEKYKFVKYLLKGEYIISSLRMVETKKEGIYEIEVADLDSIPFPYRDFPEATKYFDFSMPTLRPQLQIYSSKGCPFGCTFCLWPKVMYKGKVNIREPKKVATEIKKCVDKYGFKSIFFDDDTFNLDIKRTSFMCDELKKIVVPWTMMGRLDCSPNWLLDKMVASGCVGMRFGVESFNKDVLKKINKGLENVNIILILKRLIRKYPKLMLHLTMMKDLPGQTDKDHEKDLNILKDMGFKQLTYDYKFKDTHRSFQVSKCVPFPGTVLYKELKDKKSNVFSDFRLYDGNQDTVMSKLKNNE